MKKRPSSLSLPDKANRILNGILVVLILFLIRIWHLAVVQHEEKLEASRRPQVRTLVERAERATIQDRFGIPLATNRVQYDAAISYGEIRGVPRVKWERDAQGKKIKIYKRLQYIEDLARLIGEELQLDAEHIEDLIHAKASVYGSAPFVIKENISEKEYFRLKMLAKDWPGIHAEHVARRTYPLGPVGGEVVGYLGAISQEEYETFSSQLQELRVRVAEGEQEALAELRDLERRAYHLNDLVGKAGVEGKFDASLRGARGIRRYQTDTRGNLLRELPDSVPPDCGEMLKLAISAELQEFAEQLLAEYDSLPPSDRPAELKKQALRPDHFPWIKGGAIVAMEPQTGEVVALASYPRFDPNDFIQKRTARVRRWLESEAYLGALWDEKLPLERERFDPWHGIFYEQELPLNWETFLSMILPQSSPVRQVISEYNTVGDALFIQREIEALCRLFPAPFATPGKVIEMVYQGEEDVPRNLLITLQERDYFEERMADEAVALHKERLRPYFDALPLNYEKVLLVDLYRLAVDADRFPVWLTELVSSQSLTDYRHASAHLVAVKEAARSLARALFHENDFQQWRESEFKAFLKEKRREERMAKRKYARPYLDYLEEEEKKMFAAFWEAHQWDVVKIFLTGEAGQTALAQPYVQALRLWYAELRAGAHPALPWRKNYQELQALVAQIHRPILMPYLSTLRSFRDLERPLWGRYSGIRRGGKERDLAMSFYPTYGFGYARSQAFRQATIIGSIFKLVPAYEALRQRYEKGLWPLNPLTMIDDKHKSGRTWNVGYWNGGKTIPMYYRGGRLPRSEHRGIGSVDLCRALETSSNPYFALLAGDVLEDPEDLCRAAGLLGFGERTGIELPAEIGGRIPQDITYDRTGLYAMAIGQHTTVGTPLQVAVMLSALANGGKILKPSLVQGAPPQTRWQIFLPEEIRRELLEGMRQVVMGEKGTARSLKNQFPAELCAQIIGKTSTSEVVERVSLDGTASRIKEKHIWFGALSFEEGDFDRPELAIVVYLRLGEFGRLAAPLAVKVVEKWRELQKSHVWH